MANLVSILTILAGLSFLLQVVLERVKDIAPIIGGTYTFSIKSVNYKVSPLNFISLACGIGLMFAIGQPISLFAALGYEVPIVINHIVNGILISGGSGYIHNIIDKIEKKGEAE